MPSYYTPTVVQQILPHADVSPLERLILGSIFDAEEDESGIYFSSSEGPCDLVIVPRAELVETLAASQPFAGELNPYIAARVDALETDPNGEVEIDMSGIDWAFVLQDVLKRSTTLNYITVFRAFTVSKMCPEGWGGGCELITRDEIAGKSTHEIMEDLLDQAGLASTPAIRGAAA